MPIRLCRLLRFCFLTAAALQKREGDKEREPIGERLAVEDARKACCPGEHGEADPEDEALPCQGEGKGGKRPALRLERGRAHEDNANGGLGEPRGAKDCRPRRGDGGVLHEQAHHRRRCPEGDPDKNRCNRETAM